MANLISNTIIVSGNAEVQAYWENYVATLSQYANDFAGLVQFLWPTQNPDTIDLTEVTGTQWFVLAGAPEVVGVNLHIQSAWSPCTRYIADLWRQLRAVDPNVIVSVVWQDLDREDAGAFVLQADNAGLNLLTVSDCTSMVIDRVGPTTVGTAKSWRKTCAKIARIVESTQAEADGLTMTVTNPFTGAVFSVPLFDTAAAQGAEATTFAGAKAETEAGAAELAKLFATGINQAAEMAPTIPAGPAGLAADLAMHVLADLMAHFNAWLTTRMAAAEIAQLAGAEWAQLLTTFVQENPNPYVDPVTA